MFYIVLLAVRTALNVNTVLSRTYNQKNSQQPLYKLCKGNAIFIFSTKIQVFFAISTKVKEQNASFGN